MAHLPLLLHCPVFVLLVSTSRNTLSQGCQLIGLLCFQLVQGCLDFQVPSICIVLAFLFIHGSYFALHFVGLNIVLLLGHVLLHLLQVEKLRGLFVLD